MKCTFLGAKIAAFIETAKRILLKSVKGFEKVRPFPAPLPDIQQIGLPSRSVWISGSGHNSSSQCFSTTMMDVWVDWASCSSRRLPIASCSGRPSMKTTRTNFR